jgi:Do/DeqQ family serine protease
MTAATISVLAALVLGWAQVLPGVPTPAVVGQSVAPLVDRVKGSVVSIRSTKVIRRVVAEDPFTQYLRERLGMGGGRSQPRNETQQGLGSGFIVDKAGTIFTNNHVVAGADDVRVVLADNRSFEAKVIGSDKDTDVAVVKILNPPPDLVPVALGSSEKVRVGDYVLAIGNPLGLGQTVTMGIVSAKNRMLGGNILKLEDFIQTDAAINQGNSGGPLFNFAGEVIGINSAILNPAVAMNVGFAIPISLARRIADQIRSSGRVGRGRLGVGTVTLTPEMAKQLGLGAANGALVNVVNPRSPAEAAGLRPNDLIVEIGGVPVTNSEQVRTQILSSTPGQRVTIKFLRGGRPVETTAVLVDSLQGVPEIMGLQVQPLSDAEARELEVPGLRVVTVNQRSAASGHFRENDVIVGIAIGYGSPARATLQAFKQFEQRIAKGAWGRLIILRDGYQLELTIR